MLRRLETTYRTSCHPVVFPVSAVLIVAFVIFAGGFTETAGGVFDPTRTFITDNFGWFLIAVVASLLGLSLYLVLGPFARIKLGPDDSTPDYSTSAWFAMLFSAGMGIGLVFWGVAEPIWFFHDPPRIAAEQELAAAQEAMNFTFHHWGFSPWAIYAVIGLGLAYFGYRRGMPMTIRSLFQPLLGDRVDGSLGHLVDIVAVVATMFGIATSLGLGARQVAAGLDRVFGWEVGNPALLLIVAAITGFATISVALGLDKGIKRLSQGNLMLAAGLAGVVFITGPTLLLVTAYVENTGHYVQNIFDTLLWTGAYAGEEAGAWLGGWTIFYWAWWISWSPFVGMFIARISRGRTIREFVLGVLLAPTLVSFLWFTIFGNTALHLEIAEERAAGIITNVTEVGEHVAMFALFEAKAIPAWLVVVLSVTTIVVVVTFFVTSSDSGSFVIDMITSGGSLDPAVETRVFWALSEGAVAAVLLLAGGLTALQAGAVSTGLPFAVVLLFAAWSLVRGLRQELHDPPRVRKVIPPATVPDAVWREREQRAREQRERELELRARELDVREWELARREQGLGGGSRHDRGGGEAD